MTTHDFCRCAQPTIRRNMEAGVQELNTCMGSSDLLPGHYYNAESADMTYGIVWNRIKVTIWMPSSGGGSMFAESIEELSRLLMAEFATALHDILVSMRQKYKPTMGAAGSARAAYKQQWYHRA